MATMYRDSTLAGETLVTLFAKMLKIYKKKEFQRRKNVKKNKESFGRFKNILFLGMEPSK
jgi:hypothetical protein